MCGSFPAGRFYYVAGDATLAEEDDGGRWFRTSGRGSFELEISWQRAHEAGVEAVLA